MIKKIVLVCILLSINNIFYGEHINDHADIKKNKIINNELNTENNQGMLPVEIPRSRRYFDSNQLHYLNIVNDCKKECCHCDCRENSSLCGLLCLSFALLKCLCG